MRSVCVPLLGLVLIFVGTYSGESKGCAFAFASFREKIERSAAAACPFECLFLSNKWLWEIRAAEGRFPVRGGEGGVSEWASFFLFELCVFPEK